MPPSNTPPTDQASSYDLAYDRMVGLSADLAPHALRLAEIIQTTLEQPHPPHPKPSILHSITMVYQRCLEYRSLLDYDDGKRHQDCTNEEELIRCALYMHGRAVFEIAFEVAQVAERLIERITEENLVKHRDARTKTLKGLAEIKEGAREVMRGACKCDIAGWM